MTAALTRRAALAGAVAAAIAVPAAARAGRRAPGLTGPLTLAQTEALDFAALWASLPARDQARIGAMAIRAETFDQLGQDCGFHTTPEERNAAAVKADDIRSDLPAVIWAALPTVLPTVYYEPYPLWQALETRDGAPAEVDVRGLGRRPLVKDGWQWFAAVGGALVELGGAVDLDSRIPDAPHRWQFWTVADINAERLRRHPEFTLPKVAA